MNENIKILKTKIEELEKRLKEISTAQSNYAALKSIKEYVATIGEYLLAINNQYSSHIAECSTNTTQIEEINIKINEINTQIKNMPSVEDIDFSEINTQISTLSNNLSSLQASFNNLTNNSSATISQITTDISTIQTELASIEDYINTHNQEFEQINQSFGNIQTNIENLTTTQNNLTSTQNNLTTNVNNINTRLTSVEQEVNAITGGVDLTDLDERVGELEEIPPTFNLVDARLFNINKEYSKISQITLLEIPYSANCCGNALLKFKINYSISGNNNVTFNFFSRDTIMHSKSFYPTDHPFEIEVSIPIEFNNFFNPFYIDLSTGNTIIIESIYVEFYCKNVNYINDDTEYVPICFNNEIYLTKKNNNNFEFGKFTMDSLSLTDLPYKITFSETTPFNRLLYMPKTTSENEEFGTITDSIIVQTNNNFLQEYSFDANTGNIEFLNKYINKNKYHKIIPPFFNSCCYTLINNDEPTYFCPFSDKKYRTFKNLKKYKSGGWGFVANVSNNNLTAISSIKTYEEIMAVCLNEDGYFYLLPEMNLSYILKIGRGQSATAFKQLDGSINVYIYDRNKTNIYNISKDDSDKYDICTLIKTSTAKVTYELYNGKSLIQLTTGWKIQSI